jgi:hypothetical protein
VSKKISFGLSVSEINNAVKELRKYQSDINYKCQRFADRLADLGLQTAKAVLEKHIYSGETVGSLRIETDESGAVTKLRIVVESEAILFLEFGAGIKYSGTVNPKSSETGYGPGTYPGAGHWDDPNGWWYLGDDGEYHHSYGIEAAMPMYKATVAMRQQISSIAKEVFGS